MDDETRSSSTLPDLECDLIMKGGLTSGVVYPKLILELSRKYRFRKIGGTSAGAIAAGITAAAEFNRDGAGYGTVEELPAYLQDHLQSLFQPTPKLRFIFDALVKATSGDGSWVGLGFRGAFNFFTGRLNQQIKKHLPANGFGVCPGVTQGRNTKPALSNWLAEEIERAGGVMTDDAGNRRPLVFADLWKGERCTDAELNALPRGGVDSTGPNLGDLSSDQRRVDLRMVTSNLSLGRPHELPFMNRNTYFKTDELGQVLPRWIVDWMSAVSEIPEGTLEYSYLPVGGRMPVILAVRLSLSFPLLLSAVPLYRDYYPAKVREGGQAQRNKIMRKMWFSDGGISSNFPIHLFDSWVPSRPTFGVSLDEFNADYMRNRVYLPTKAGAGRWPALSTITSVPQFASAMIGTAMGWQDQLQTLTPGFTERVVRVALDKDREGGLNLNMEPDVVGDLMGYGEEAGTYLAGTSGDPGKDFNFDDHRWRRFLILFEQLEAELEAFAEDWTQAGPDGRTVKQFLDSIAQDPPSYAQSTQAERRAAIDRLDALVAHVQAWKQAGSLRENLKGPRPSPEFKINARMVENIGGG